MKWKVQLVDTRIIPLNTQEIITLDATSDTTTTLELLAGASVTVHVSQTPDTFAVNHSLTVVLHDDARCSVVCIVENSLTILFVQFVLKGNHSQATLAGLLKTGNNHVHTIKTEQIHQGVATKSNVKLRGTVEKSGQHTFEGLIRLEPGSRGSVAHQEHKALLLDPSAVVKSVPSLQVFHNDVVCGHGTALSYIQQQDLCALALRGIEESQARLLLIQAFLAPE